MTNSLTLAFLAFILVSFTTHAGEVVHREDVFLKRTQTVQESRWKSCLSDLKSKAANDDFPLSRNGFLSAAVVGLQGNLDLDDLNTPLTYVYEVLRDLNVAESDLDHRLDVRRFALRVWDLNLTSARIYNDGLSPVEIDFLTKILFYASQDIFYQATDNRLAEVTKHLFYDDPRLPKGARYQFLSALLVGVDIERAVNADIKFKFLIGDWIRMHRDGEEKSDSDEIIVKKLEKLRAKNPYIIGFGVTPRN